MSWETNKPAVSPAKQLLDRAAEQAKSGDLDAALQTLVEAEAKDPDNYLVYYQRSALCVNLGRFEEALAAADRTIELTGGFAEIYSNRAAALHPLGRSDEAIADCDTAIKLKPDYPMGYYNKGVVLGELKRYEESIAAYNRAIKLDPNYTYAIYNRASMQACMGRKDEMLADLTRAIELDVGEREYAKDDESFDPFRDEPEFRKLVYPEEFN